MTLQLIIKPHAEDDVDDHAAYLDDQEQGLGARFLAEAHHVFDRLVEFPHLGQLWDTTQPEHLGGVRRVVLPSFQISFFYRPSESAVDVLRVLHHARNVPRLLAES